MAMYVKVDRVTNKVLKRGQYDTIDRCFNKRVVWLEVESAGYPALNTTTVPDPSRELGTSEIRIQKAIKTESFPDLSDLNTDVPPDTKFTIGYNVVDMTAGEIQSVKDSFINGAIAGYDKQLLRMLERLMVVIAVKPDSPPKREDFPDSDWDLLNKFRAYKDEAPI